MERSVASWNALIAGLIHYKQISKALKIFSLMQWEGNISPYSITLANVFPACSDLNYAHFSTKIHGYSTRRDILLDIVFTIAFAKMYSNCFKNIRHFWQTFENSKNFLTKILWYTRWYNHSLIIDTNILQHSLIHN